MSAKLENEQSATLSSNMTFSAFDVGNSSQDEVSLVADWMTDFGYTSNGTYDNADGVVTAATIKYIGKNSDVVYINGHGERFANIVVLHSSSGTPNNPDEYLCADSTVSSKYSRTKTGIGAEFLPGSISKTTSYWNSGTKWAIIAACAQLDHNGVGEGNHWNGKYTSAETWARTLLGNGQRMHGYVGYYNTAPGGSLHTTRLNNFFGYCMNNNLPIVDAWANAHTLLTGSSDWAAVYHSANANDRFQSMSATTSSNASYEIYHIGRNMTEENLDIKDRACVLLEQTTINNQRSLPCFSNVKTEKSLAEETKNILQNKLGATDGDTLEVTSDGRIKYSVGKRNWGELDLVLDLTDSEAVSIAKQTLDSLGLLSQEEYRTVVSRIQRTKMNLLEDQENAPETIEYTVAFYRTYNGIDVLSDQEDGILVSFNKDGLTELRYMWRALEEFTTNRAASTEMVTLQQAQNIYQNVLESGDLIKCAKDGVNKAASSCVTTAYLQIGNAVKPVWAFSTDSSYTNCVFIDMYTGDVLTVD